MNPKGNWLELVIISSLFLLLSVWGIVWDITSGLLTSGIDGIMLIAVCLLMAAIFAVMLMLQLQKAGFLPSVATKPKAVPAPPTAAKQPVPSKPAAPARETTTQTK